MYSTSRDGDRGPQSLNMPEVPDSTTLPNPEGRRAGASGAGLWTAQLTWCKGGR